MINDRPTPPTEEEWKSINEDLRSRILQPLVNALELIIKKGGAE